MFQCATLLVGTLTACTQVWKLVKPVLSTQIIKDVEAFVAAVPIDSQSTVSVMFYGTSKPPVGSTLRGERQAPAEGDQAFTAQGTSSQPAAGGTHRPLSEDTIYMAGNNRAKAISLAAARALERARQRRSTQSSSLSQDGAGVQVANKPQDQQPTPLVAEPLVAEPSVENQCVFMPSVDALPPDGVYADGTYADNTYDEEGEDDTSEAGSTGEGHPSEGSSAPPQRPDSLASWCSSGDDEH